MAKTTLSKNGGICKQEGCKSNAFARGYCSKHYWKIKYKHGFPPIQPEVCTKEGCDNPTSARGLCSKHYAEGKSKGYFSYKKCSVPDCDSPSRTKGLCGRHYMQKFKYGQIQERTTHDNNEIEILDDMILINLYDKEGSIIDKAKVDLDDLGKVENRRWHLHSTGYVYDSKKNLLHKVIIGEIPNGLETDHANRDKLDNRKSNLRTATRSQNACNVVRAKNKSGYKGVFLNKRLNKYAATIKKDNKTYYLGVHPTKTDAAISYNEKAKELHGDFACLNDI